MRGNPVVFQGTEQNKGNLYDDLMYGLADSWNRWSMVEKDADGNVIADHFNTKTDTYQLIAQLNHLKDLYPALSYGTQREMWSSSNVYAFSRRIDSGENAGDEIICAFNNSSSRQSAFIPIRSESSLGPGTVLENVFDASDRITVSTSRKIAVDLEGNSNKIYKVSEDQTKTTVPVTFYIQNATTNPGENLFITGNSSILGNWNPTVSSGVCNCPAYPTWNVSVNLPVGSTIQFKAVKCNGSQTTWESGNNREYTVPSVGGALSLVWDNAGETELVPVKFTIKNATTEYGENVYITGNVSEIGNWSVSQAVGPALCPDYPEWIIFADVPVGKTIEWKALIKKSDGTVRWQGCSNNSYTVPSDGTGATSTNWQ